jgi:hypothetical protein
MSDTGRGRRARAWTLRLSSILVAALIMSSLTAPPANALVLVNAPATRINVQDKIKVGVWYRAWEGGPRAYRVKVLNPKGAVIFSRKGKAPTTWKFWNVRANRVGVFKTVYRVKNAEGTWVRIAFRTRVVRK